ncbi:hypothetical protein GCM10009789_59550 [Kribbella sancticallisti]|uniref:Uncharacterized protein n=1 Tax=Kribbella sancticallisti TaxID=460087 RepID=A0ABP4Q145_9ACTN
MQSGEVLAVRRPDLHAAVGVGEPELEREKGHDRNCISCPARAPATGIWCGKGVTSRHSGWFRSDPKVDE